MTNTFYNKTLRLASLFIGENPDYVATFYTSSKRRVMLNATCLLIPVLLWLALTYLACKDSFALSTQMSILVAGFFGTIIYIIERTILNAERNVWSTLFRVALGLATALLGSVFADECIFKHDIDNKIQEMRVQHKNTLEQTASTSYNDKIAEQQAKVDIAKQAWQTALGEAVGEADGSRGSKVAKRGKITELKLAAAKELQKEHDKQAAILAQVKQARDAAVEDGVANAKFNEHGLLTSIKALFTLIADDVYMRSIYVIITCFVFLLEFLVVIIKLTSKPTINDLLEQEGDALALEQYKAKLAKLKQHYKPQDEVPRVKAVTQFLSTPSLNAL
jgi:hypothetical protein